MAYYLVISKIKDKGNLKIFIITMVLGGIVEYLFSFFKKSFLERFLGIIVIYGLI